MITAAVSIDWFFGHKYRSSEIYRQSFPLSASISCLQSPPLVPRANLQDEVKHHSVFWGQGRLMVSTTAPHRHFSSAHNCLTNCTKWFLIICRDQRGAHTTMPLLLAGAIFYNKYFTPIKIRLILAKKCHS